MPFQVKATVTGFLGDEERYLYHFRHKVGEEFMYDAEKYVGPLCPSMCRVLIPEMMPFHAIGPRVISPLRYYYSFQYAPVSRKVPENARYDGMGFGNVLATPVEPPYHMSVLRLNPSVWPPPTERTIQKQASTATRILNQFSKKEIEKIYPALSPIMVDCLLEELQLMEYIETTDGKVSVTEKGRARLEGFKAELSKEERQALRM